jgi:hypothetical protein
VSSDINKLPPLLNGAQLLAARQRRGAAKPLATSVAPFDAALQGGGLARGALIELCGRRSSGRFSIALAALAAATAAAESAALIDCCDSLDPQAAQAAGVDLSRLLWLRPRRLKEALLGAEMVLGAGFALVVLDLGGRAARGVPDGAWLRLARAARARDAALLLLSPRPTAGTAAAAVVRCDASRPVWDGAGRGGVPLLSGLSVRLTVERGRASAGGGPLALPVREDAGA